MPQDTASILKDPNFANLAPDERIKVLNTVDENFRGLPEPEKMKVVSALGGPPSPVLTDVQKAAMAREKIPVNASPTFIQGQKAVLKSKMEEAQPQSTMLTRAREATIGVLEPFTLPNLFKAAKAAYNAQLSINDNPFSLESYKPAAQLVESAVTAPVQPVVNFVEGLRTGDYDRAAYGSGGMLSQTVPAVEGGANLVEGASSLLDLRTKARNLAQNMTSSTAFKTTQPMVENYNTAAADAAARQAKSDTAVGETNRAALADAAEKNARNQAKVTGKNEAAMTEADIATEQNQAKVTAENQKAQTAHQQELAETRAHNQDVLARQNRAATLDSNLREGSQQLGQDLVDLNDKLKGEADVKYQKVYDKVDSDPGIPVEQMAEAAKKSQKLLEGSAESIKQFNELIRKAPEEEGVMIDGAMRTPGDPLYDMLNKQGALQTGGEVSGDTISFRDLKGYSSEISRRLADGKGEIPSDVYRALQDLKGKLDAAKAEIAERNGAGAELTDAEDFFRKWKDAYGKTTAAGQTFRRVGVLDPEFYSEPFTKGKASGVGLDKLSSIPTQFADTVSAIVDRVKRLKSDFEESQALKIPKAKPEPTAPTPKTPGPRAMATLEPNPEPVVAETTPRKIVEGPKPPTAAEIVADKRQRVEARGRSLMTISNYDAANIAAVPAGVLLGHPLLGLAPLAAKYGLSYILTRPGIIDWIAKPTVADIAAIDKMPPAAQGALRTQLQGILDQESAAGRAVQPAGAIRNFLQRTQVVNRTVAVPTNSSAGVKNRRDALEALGHPAP
jgi:hypothetical protein